VASRFLIFMLVCAPLPGWGQTQPPVGSTPIVNGVLDASIETVRQRLLQWFSGYEFVPEASDYAGLGSHLGPALESIARDSSQDLVRRARAVSAMAYAIDQPTLSFVGALLADEGARPVLRRKAALVLGLRAGEGAVAALASAFGSAIDDVFLREACARALRQLGPAGDETRQRLLIAEKASSVRALLEARKRVGEIP